MSSVWPEIKKEIELRINAEPKLGNYMQSLILSQNDFLSAVASILASKLDSDALNAVDIKKFLLETYYLDENLEESILADLEFVMEKDPACKHISTPLLFIKDF